MAKRTLIRLAAVAGAASLVLAGCGTETDDTAADTETGSDLTEVELAETDCDPPQAEPSGNPSTDPLRFGGLLPQTGDLAFLGPPEIAATELAVSEINEAGGVLGSPVSINQGDSGDTTTNIANQTVDRLLADGAQVIVGAASSGVSLSVIDKIVDAGVVMFSPANTSDQFVCYPDRGMYFRTAPTDVLQSQALVQMMAGDGVQRVSILARNDPYGAGLARNTERFLQEAGIAGDQIDLIIYDPNAQSFNAEIDRIAQFDPDGIAVIGFDESKRIITRMAEVGIGPQDKLVYGTDGNMGNALGEGLPAGLLEGMKGTAPQTALSGDFEERVRQAGQEAGFTLSDLQYSAEAYDAVIISALAAEAAASTNGVDIAAEINGVTQDGEDCTSFAECRDLIADGQDINYNGVTGDLEFRPAGEPGIGSYGVLEFGPDNQLLEVEDYIIVSID
ncbi:ABC transporter substrate-binding protein [Hoyosella sp. YIM 151337]|uniref:ABC transporter substrate-binding protein n=1 Tax=Hoyosella sp. YIM 151337 TaxID=2992742 RepID=UPI002235EABF|nr:ABC transporter substrate-binding protein [Hoyosella sp. YIM 151337]MCW4355601.1 ABC transporter substrate-binding protein [Hoyosella sp. YIM 151337]